jgi:GNAT superfamily N-acetyltransferase
VSPVSVRPAREEDSGLVHRFICELAAYERMSERVTARVEDIRSALFGRPPRAFCVLAEAGGAPVGFALWFYNFSTFEGRAGLYLEDLYVTPEARGRGAGKALLAHLARICLDEGLGRMDWSVLDWNAPSIAFYDSLGAEAKPEWILRRLSGAALEALAKTDQRPV